MLNRIWTAIVGGVAGISIGVVVAILLIKSMPLDRALVACWTCGGIGFVLGFAFAKRKVATEKSR
jgi:hypothetical protein